MKGLKKLAVLCAGCITFAGIASVMPANRLLKTDTTVYASSEKPSEIVTEGLFTFLWYSDCAYLLSCDENAEGKVVIPDKINGAPVTTISGLSRYWSGDFKDPHAFYGCTKITSVVIPDSVTSINRKAFGDCTSLREITIPDSVSYIGEDAFSGTPWLKAKQKENPLVIAGSILIDGTTCKGKVIIPDGVTSIGVNAFVNCSALTGITIPDSVTSIEESAFENCSGLTGITIPDGVTSIGNRAFENCSGLTGITIPTSVSDIGGRIFSGTGIQKITVPGGVKEIYGTTFLECSELTDLTILDPFCNLYDTVVSNTGSTFSGVIHGYDGSTAEKYATEHNIRFESLGAFSYTDAYGRCGDNATWKIDKDYTMVISGTGEMESYGGYEARFAFYWNYKDYIKKIRIEEGITGIPGQAFRNLDQVTDISFPKSLKTINSFAVDETLWWKKQLETEDFIIINDILVKCNVQGKVTVPDTVHSIMPNSFENDGITELVLPDGLTELESWILTYSTIKAVTLPESLTRLGYYAFEGCRSLEEIVIPEKTESIGSGAFSNCESLKSITILNPDCEIFDEARTISDKVDYDYNMDTGKTTITASYSGVIRGYAGSTAEAYAKKYGYTFEALSKEAVTTTAKAVTTTAQAATTTAKAATTTAKAVTTTAKAVTTTAKAATTTAKAVTTTAKAATTTAKAVTTTAKAATTTAKAATTTAKAVTTTAKAATTTAKAVTTTAKAVTTTAKAVTTTAKAVTTTAPVTTTTTAAKPLESGDLTGDNLVGIEDAQIALKAYTEKFAGKATGLTDAQIKAADVNGDGDLTVEDAQLILIYYTEKNVAGKNITWKDLLKK